MSKEPMSNIVFIPKEFASKPNPKHQNHSSDYYVGKYVKLAFTHNARTEHMWVMVESFSENIFHGKLDNDPTIIPNLKDGDPVQFKVEEIEDLIEL